MCKSTQDLPRAKHARKIYDSTFYPADTDLLHTEVFAEGQRNVVWNIFPIL